MANNVTQLPSFGGPVSSKLANVPVENELGAGIAASFGVMKYKGKGWKTVYKGEENTLMRPDGDGARNSIDVVILKATKVKSKTYYIGGFVDGSHAPPDCSSNNGVTPNADSPHKQAELCDLCPKNQWGSAIRDGKPAKGKACADVKRTAIVPANPGVEDPAMLRNEALGGPMLLRVPPASLNPLQVYGERLAKSGYNAWAVITNISFDPMEAYPKYVFKPVRPLTDAELEVAMELCKSAQVERIVAEDVYVAEAPMQFAAPLPTQTPTTSRLEAPKLAVVPPATAASAPSAPVVVTPPVTETGLPQNFEAQLDALLK
jgi:hypothetical protein